MTEKGAVDITCSLIKDLPTFFELDFLLFDAFLLDISMFFLFCFFGGYLCRF